MSLYEIIYNCLSGEGGKRSKCSIKHYHPNFKSAKKEAEYINKLDPDAKAIALKRYRGKKK